MSRHRIYRTSNKNSNKNSFACAFLDYIQICFYLSTRWQIRANMQILEIYFQIKNN